MACRTMSSIACPVSDVGVQPASDGLRHASYVAWQSPMWKADMAPVRRLPQGDLRAHLSLARQAPRRHKGVVAGVDHQGRYTDARQMGFGRRSGPIVFRAAKAVQWRGEHIVELVQVTRAGQGLWVEQARELRQFLHRLGLHGVEEHARVNQAVEASPNGPSTRGQIDWRADRRTPRTTWAAMWPASSAQRSKAFPP